MKTQQDRWGVREIRKNWDNLEIIDKIVVYLVGLFCLMLMVLSLLFISACEVEACTYEEAISADYSGYNLQDVERILNEDITVPSNLSDEQKSACLIGDMKDFTEEFDKRCGSIKFEALAAISAAETGYFTSEVSALYNNVGGMMVGDEYLSYNSKVDGIQALSDLLNNHYIDPDGVYFEGKTILDIGKNYNPRVHWVNLYVKVRLDMEKRCENAVGYRKVTRSDCECGRGNEKSCTIFTRCFTESIQSNLFCKKAIPESLLLVGARKDFPCKKEEQEKSGKADRGQEEMGS